MNTFDFFTPQRLDLVCKYAFFCDLLNEQNDEFVLTLYKEHILKRTDGREPRDRFNKTAKHKRSIDDYVEVAHELFHNMKQNGFDENCAVPYTDEGLLLNGAHRIACAAALGTDIVTTVIYDNKQTRKPWGLEWFQNNQFTEKQIEFVQSLYNEIKQGNSNEKNTA